MMGRYLLRFREAGSGAAAPTPGIAKTEQPAGLDRRLLCHACGQVITSEAARRAVNGAHQHKRTNPAGFRFHFGCFSQAPGCGGVGQPSGEHSWFAGCVWRIAVCGACGEHLGWRFSGADEFFALILDRIIQAAE